MRHFSILCLLAVLPVAANAQPLPLPWDEQNPFNIDEGSTLETGGGLIVSSVADPLTSGRENVGEVIFPGGSRFMNINNGFGGGTNEFEILTEDYGKMYRWSLDYYFPDDTAFDANGTAGGSPDLFWVQSNFNGLNVAPFEFNHGFIGPMNEGVVAGQWNTLTGMNVIPETIDGGAVTFISPQIVLVDGGFGDGTPNGDGVTVAMYIDNIKFEVLESQPGDFNGDGVVNAADYTTWRDNLGAADDAPINNAGDGVAGVSADDYAVWASNFGSGAPASANAIPEPSTALLALVGLLAACGAARR